MYAYRSRSIVFSCSVVLAFAVAGCNCGSSGSDASGTGGSGATGGTGGAGATGGSGGACPESGDGTVDAQVTGLPDGVAGDVTLTGPSGDRAVEHTEMIGSAAGSYTVSAEPVTSPDPIVRTAYEPTITSDAFCLDASGTESVGVAYAAVPTSHKLWTTNGPGGAGALLAFDGASLAASGDVAATVTVQSGAGKDVTFDREGNLWSFGATVGDPTLLRYPVASLGTSGTKEPDREINIDFGGCSPATSGMAFDPDGNLWVTSPCANSVVRVSVDQLAVSGDVTPGVEITGLEAPRGLAFDKEGNLWVADIDAQQVSRYDAAHLASSIAAPDHTITATTLATGGSTFSPAWLAFDGAGSLWVNDFGGNAVFPIAAADLDGTGDATVVPSVQITIGVTALLESMAFDESGGLWMAGSMGKIIRLAPAQLTVSTGPGDPTVPATIVSSADIGYVSNLAFYPAPAALPLYHRMP